MREIVDLVVVLLERWTLGAPWMRCLLWSEDFGDLGVVDTGVDLKLVSLCFFSARSRLNYIFAPVVVSLRKGC